MKIGDHVLVAGLDLAFVVRDFTGDGRVCLLIEGESERGQHYVVTADPGVLRLNDGRPVLLVDDDVRGGYTPRGPESHIGRIVRSFYYRGRWHGTLQATAVWVAIIVLAFLLHWFELG